MTYTAARRQLSTMIFSERDQVRLAVLKLAAVNLDADVRPYAIAESLDDAVLNVVNQLERFGTDSDAGRCAQEVINLLAQIEE